MDPTCVRAAVAAPGGSALEGMPVAVSSDQRLVAETIGAGLRSLGVQTEVVPWWPQSSVSRPCRGDAEASDPGVVFLLACDLGTRARVDEARIRGKSRGVPWVVMTESAPGPAWGAMLEAGARAVVTSTISLTALVELLCAVVRGESPIGEVERRGLLREWRSAKQDQDRLRERMESLSPREQEVLSMLYEGITVRTIAGRLGVSEATVRSQVKSVLRKLAVASQLAAVAAVREFRTDDGPDG
ncbi:MAG: bvgA [Ramlibacter sp.]|nr:bvgA [Ramlibacter sp.]